ncbi:MAG: zf-TFIIB domain-containing protein [Polaromonas sp.]|nr:zf-TFIIB domain-containing protein [Polaromonas sp.]
MKCPTCPDSILVMTDRQSVEIDYCPQCRGVWLDRGELDKLMALGANQTSVQRPVMVPRPDFVDSDHHKPYGSQGYPQKRKKSWLNEIFD